ncbi:MAG TPA: protein kinase [Polyangiales bacterium]|nr:protein kinase [Polyangiales bacterium]
MPGQSSPPSAALPLVAGRYRIESKLGKGGVGEVFKVTDISRGTPLALKRLPLGASNELQSLFEREYQTLASLRHPHTVEVLEFGRDAGGAFYTMELLSGGDLRERVPLPWREACAALRDAALALGVLHARGLMHRDVSPRNLWRLPDGSVKLIDFGAVEPFGRPAQLIGTPPLVPPEAFLGEALDQRADLYALGAVGYFLVSGRNAFPARGMHELPELWRQRPPPPSAAGALPALAGFPPIPAELDALLLGLLSRNPLARPASTAELIDRLDALLEQSGPARADSAELHLANPAFVGRVRERRRAGRLLALAARGRGQSAILEGDAGMGRSRLLAEVALDARVANACVLHVDAASYPGLYGVASALAFKLLDGLPLAAASAAAPHASTLAHASPALRDRLQVRLEKPPDVAGELRMRIQAAFVDWFKQVAQEQTLVLLVDGLELIDDGSCACLLKLAQDVGGSRVLLVCTRLRGSGRRRTAAVRALLECSRRMRLPRLTETQTLELLQSVFGRPEHLIRLASCLQQRARGTPGHILSLAEQLVRSNAIRFANGTWALPQEIPDAQLPGSWQLALAARLARVTGQARELGRALSVQPGAIPPALFEALAGAVGAHTSALATLIEREIMTRDADGLRFSHEEHRSTLLAELAPERKQLALRALGHYLLADPGAGALERLRAGVHLIESGDWQAVRIVAAAATDITLRDPDRLAPAMSSIEHALALFRAAGRPLHELTTLLGPLAVAGYFVDRKYAANYGDEALAALSEVLGLALARKLRPLLGARLALFTALTVTAARFLARRKQLPSPNFEDALTLFFMSASTLAGSSGLCFDYENTRRAAEALEPFAVLGTKFAPGFAYQVCAGLATATRDAFGESHARWVRTVAMLESEQPIIGLPDHLRVRYSSGLVFAMGIMDSQRDDDSALRAADRLDRTGAALYPMSTDQLRAVYYAHRGNAELYAHYRERAEQRAIQQGAIWQNETWTLLVETVVSLRHHDAMGMKRVSEQLRSASKVIPTLEVYADRSRGTYLLMRGRAGQALPWLEKCLAEEPRANFGWGRSHGVLARAYNELGRHADARAACERVLGEFTAADLAFPGLTLLVETELLIAQAGQGDLGLARDGLARLFERHRANGGALTLAELHEAGVRIELLAGDRSAAREHCDEMASWYEGTGIASLVQYCQEVRAQIQLPLGAASAPKLSLPPSAELTYLPSLGPPSTTGSSHLTLPELAQRALQVLIDQHHAEHGYLYWVDDDECRPAASLAPVALDTQVERWLKTRIAQQQKDTTTVLVKSADKPSPVSRDVFQHGARSYRVMFLFHAESPGDGPFGAALVVSDGELPARSLPRVVDAVAQQLHEGLRLSGPGL